MTSGSAKRLLPAAVLAGIFMLTAIFYAASTGYSPSNYLENQRARQLTEPEQLGIEGEAKALWGEWLVFCSDGIVIGRNLKNQDQWNVKIPEGAQVFWVEDGILYREAGLLKACGFDGKQVWAVKFSTDLKTVYGSLQSGILLHYTGLKSPMISAFSATGRYLWELPVSGEELLSGMVSPQGEIIINLAEMSHGLLKSKLLNFSKTGELRWAYSLGEYVAAVLFRYDKKAVAIDPTRIIYLTEDGEVFKDYMLHEKIIKADYNPAGLLVTAYKPEATAGGKTSFGLKLYNPDGKALFSYRLKSEPISAQITGDGMETVVAVENEIYAVSNTGKVLFRYKTNDPIEDVLIGETLFPLIVKTGTDYSIFTGFS